MSFMQSPCELGAPRLRQRQFWHFPAALGVWQVCRVKMVVPETGLMQQPTSPVFTGFFWGRKFPVPTVVPLQQRDCDYSVAVLFLGPLANYHSSRNSKPLRLLAGKGLPEAE